MYYELSMIAMKVKKLEWRNKVLKNRNRMLKKRLEEEKTCKTCDEFREKTDLLVKKCEVNELHVDIWERKYLKKIALLQEAQQEIERLNAVVRDYEEQIAAYAQMCGTKGATQGDVDEYFEFEMVPQTPQEVLQGYSIRDPILNTPNELDENTGSDTRNEEIKEEPTVEFYNVTLDNADLRSGKVAQVTLEKLTFLDPNDQQMQNANANLEHEQDDRCSAINGHEGTDLEVEEEQNEENEGENNNENEDPSDESQTCKWIQRPGRVCGKILKSSRELMKHLRGEHLGSPGRGGYVCHWEGCRRNKVPMKMLNNMVTHFGSHCKNLFRCSYDGCGKAYCIWAHFYNHRTKHPFRVKCTFPKCIKLFNSIVSMKNHLRDHPTVSSVASSPVPKDLSSALELSGSTLRNAVDGEIGKDTLGT